MTPPLGQRPPSARPLAAFALLSFSYFACLGLYAPYAPLWFKELGFSTLAIGVIASLQAWTRVVAPYVWSWLGDHGGQRVLLLRVAAGGALLASLVLCGWTTYGVVLVATVLIFSFNAGIVPLSEAALSRHLAQGGGGMDAGRYGRVRAFGSVGFIVTVVAGGAGLQAFGLGLFPWAVALIYALLLAATLNLSVSREAPSLEVPPRVGPVLRQPAIRWFFASIFFTVLAHTSQYAFFSLYLDALGYSKPAVGLLWALSVMAEIVFFWFQGLWFHRLTPQAWLKLAALAAALRFAVTAGFGEWTAVLVLAQLGHALTFAAHHASCTVLLHRHFPGRLRGRGQALYSTLGYGASGVLGGVGGGWLISHWGFASAFWASSLMGLVAWGCARQFERLQSSLS